MFLRSRDLGGSIQGSGFCFFCVLGFRVFNYFVIIIVNIVVLPLLLISASFILRELEFKALPAGSYPTPFGVSTFLYNKS